MTHVILGIIGILLASAAALMVVSYGGDYYEDAYNDGDALNVENSLSNVTAAYRLHESNAGLAPANMAELLPETGSGLLAALPEVRGSGTLLQEWRSISIGARTVDAVAIEGVNEQVCLTLNDLAPGSDIPIAPRETLGCFFDGSVNVAYRAL